MPKLTIETRQEDSQRAANIACILFGALVSLCITGYQFGRGNHTVYLLEGIRLADPTLYRNDWFVTSTLQYHALFGHLTALLIRAHILEPAFLAFYLAIVLLWHFAWLSAALDLGCSRLTYLLSVILFHLSAGGVGLGVYQFLQDGCFLPSNVANVALFLGLLYWCRGRTIASGAWFGLAGLFHLNHASIGIGLWGLLSLWKLRELATRRFIVGTLLAIVPSAINIGLALRMKLSQSDAMPLAEFIDVYVRFRHSHHFDPLAWPAGLWVSFLWPIPFGAWMLRKTGPTTWSRVFWIILALQVVSFLGAGVWWVNETLVQLMFWRVSIYVKLISCIGAAWALCDALLLSTRARGVILALMPIGIGIAVMVIIGTELAPPIVPGMVRDHLGAVVLFVLLSGVPLVWSHKPPSIVMATALIIVGIIAWPRWLGLGMTPEVVSESYLKVCIWARENSPIDAVFLVPPDDTVFRMEARRAIVINFKHVPQLSGEMRQWLDRVKDVAGIEDIHQAPREYVSMLHEIRRRYDARSADDLVSLAKKYRANFIVVDHPMSAPTLEQSFQAGEYFVYHLREP